MPRKPGCSALRSRGAQERASTTTPKSAPAWLRRPTVTMRVPCAGNRTGRRSDTRIAMGDRYQANIAREHDGAGVRRDPFQAGDQGHLAYRHRRRRHPQIEGEPGVSLTPNLGTSAGHDGADSETGLLVQIWGGIAWTDSLLGLSLDLRNAIEDGDLKDWGVSASLAFDPDPATERGTSLSLRQDTDCPPPPAHL